MASGGFNQSNPYSLVIPSGARDLLFGNGVNLSAMTHRPLISQDDAREIIVLALPAAHHEPGRDVGPAACPIFLPLHRTCPGGYGGSPPREMTTCLSTRTRRSTPTGPRASARSCARRSTWARGRSRWSAVTWRRRGPGSARPVTRSARCGRAPGGPSSASR